MAPSERSVAESEWRLGIEPQDDFASDAAAAAPRFDHLARLERAVHVITLEQLAWFAIAGWTLFTRLFAAGIAPLSVAEAAPALYAYDLAKGTSEAANIGFDPIWSGWIDYLRAAAFAAFGSSDYAARLPGVLGGLLLIAIAFELRHYLGRAGAIALAAMLALSPSTTWFTAAGGDTTIAMALGLVTLALFMALKAQPSRRRAIWLGAFAGLMLAADPIGIVVAAAWLVALALLGVAELFAGRSWLRARVWFSRYGVLAIYVACAAIVVWGFSQWLIGFPIDDLGVIGEYLASVRLIYLSNGLLRAALSFGFYDFLIAIAAIVGAVAVLSLRTRGRFAQFCLLWTLIALAYYAALPQPAPAHILFTIVPAALLGGIATDYLYQLDAWQVVRWLALGLVLLTLYIQILSNFLFAAPDSTEAPWSRHGNLYWSEGATPLQAADQCRAIRMRIARSRATIFQDDEWPAALRWYLREARPVTDRETATIRIAPQDLNAAASDPANTYRFDYQESWIADASKLDAHRAFDYFFTERIWGDPDTRSITIHVNPRNYDSAPTLILPP